MGSTSSILTRSKDWTIRSLRANPSMQGLPFWIAALAVGVFAATYSNAFFETEKFLHHLLLNNPNILWWFSPLCFLAGWAMIEFVCKGAGGSGIPQVRSVYELGNLTEYSQSIRKIMGLRVWIVKIFSSLLACLGGGGMANEGPTIQIAAGIFFSVGKRFQKIWPQLKPEFFIVAGAGAGVAAAFNTPLGGIVYAIEEFASAQLHRFKTVLISAVIIAGMIAQALIGSYLYLGYPRLEPITLNLYPWVILLALLGGWWGALFGRVVHTTSAWRMRKVRKRWQKATLAIVMGLLIAALYKFVDVRSIGAGKNVVTELLFEGYDSATAPLVLARFLSPLLSYLSGAAGGLFAPALAAGGSLGALFASYTDAVHINILILVGMIAFMTGVTRLPFTSFVLVLEMTDRHSAIFPMMLAGLFAQASARLVDSENLYHYLAPLYKARLKKDPHI